MASETPPIGFNPKPALDEKTKNSLYLRDNPALFDINVASRNLPPLLRPPMGNEFINVVLFDYDKVGISETGGQVVQTV
jgi:hypothetical protein